MATHIFYVALILDGMTLVTHKKGKMYTMVKDVPKDDNNLDKPFSFSLLYSWNDVIDLAKDPDAYDHLPGLR